jgi:hypothetical protein
MRSLLSAPFQFYFYRFFRPHDASIRFRFPAPKKKEKQKEKKKEKSLCLSSSRHSHSSPGWRDRLAPSGVDPSIMAMEMGKTTVVVFGPLGDLPQQKHNILFVLDWSVV